MRGGNARKIDWFEFRVRFSCGALFGLLPVIRLILYRHDRNPAVLVLIAVGVILLCGFSAA
jgi:hypothetical protein